MLVIMVIVRWCDNVNCMEDIMIVFIVFLLCLSQVEICWVIWNMIWGLLGNLVEWYDVYVYIVFVMYFED